MGNKFVGAAKFFSNLIKGGAQKDKGKAIKKGQVGTELAIKRKSQDDFVEFIEKCLFKYSIEPLHLYCLNDHYNEIMKLLKGVLSCYQKLYRIDPFVNNTVVKPLKDRSILFLHIGQYSEEMLKKAKCNKIYHLFCSGINELEPNGRLIRIRYKSDYYRSSKAWLSQLT